MKKLPLFFIKILIILTSIFFVINNKSFNIEFLIILFKKIDPLNYLLLLILILMVNHFAFLRWFYAVRVYSRSVTKINLFMKFYKGHFLNQTLPFSFFGDIYRVLALQGEYLSTKDSIATILIERLIALIALITLITIYLPRWISYFGSSFVCEGLLAIFIIFFFFYTLFNKKIKKIFIIKLTRPFFNFSLSFFYSICAFSGLIFIAYLINRNIGLNLDLNTCFFIFPPILLIASLPLSWGGWGLREATTFFIFDLLHINPTYGLTISIVIGFIILIGSTPGLFLILLCNKEKLWKV
jgi:uncharacterized membrane protein YbhN (UPF0104 family)